MASSASDQGAGRRIRPLSVFTSGSGQSSHAPPPRTRSRPPQPCLFPPLLRTGGARPSPLTAPFLRLRGPQPRLRPSATQRGPARPSPLRSGPQPRVSSPRPCALLGRPDSARDIFFSAERFFLLILKLLFYRKVPRQHAYNNSQTVHRIKTNLI